MGGDMIALAFHCLFGILILIIVETGVCYIFSRARSKRSNSPNQNLDALIEVKDLHKVYFNTCCKSKESTKDALQKTSFHVMEHECFSLLGENGAGKSTCFKILTNAIRKSSGTVRLLGLDADSNTSKISKEMGYCPQDSVLFDLLTVEEHLYFYARLRCLTNRKAHIDALIETL